MDCLLTEGQTSIAMWASWILSGVIALVAYQAAKAILLKVWPWQFANRYGDDPVVIAGSVVLGIGAYMVSVVMLLEAWRGFFCA